MNAKERIMRTLNGFGTDRVPVYTMIPFALDGQSFIPGPFHGYSDYDDWRMRDKFYNKIVKRMQQECDNFFVWRPSCMNAQNLFIPDKYVKSIDIEAKEGVAQRRFMVDAGGKTLCKTEGYKKGTGHTWVTEHFCKSADEALSLLELDYEKPDCQSGELKSIKNDLGERGVVWVTIPSPILAVCRLFDPQDFLLIYALEPQKIKVLMDTAAQRIKENLISILESGECDIVRFGGAEHATPPLMSPKDFDALVFNYDKPLMDICASYGAKIAVHCHGNIKHALERFSQMGVDQTDPVESAPFGEVTLTQARKITNSKITLTGNIQFSELVNENMEYIKKRVDGIIRKAGKKRLIVTTSATPLEAITQKLYDNYNAMIDAVIDYAD